MMDGFDAFRRSPDDEAMPRPEDDAEGDRVGLMVLPFRAPLLPLLMKQIRKTFLLKLSIGRT